MKSRKNGCFGGTIGGIDGFDSEAGFAELELAGLGGALGSGGGSNGPYRPQAARPSASRTASALRRAILPKRYEKWAATNDSRRSPALYRNGGRGRGGARGGGGGGRSAPLAPRAGGAAG